MNKYISNKILFVVSAAFFLSGACGLVYEVIWTRYLADLMGGTSLSQFVVLAVFMGGLALGAILIGRFVDQGRNGLICYGCLEVGIGLYAVIFPFLYRMATALFYFLGANLGPGSIALLFLKILIAFLLIALPSVAMGATLPAVTRYLTLSQFALRRNISLLYGINSLGAMLGILAGGFFLVYRFGVAASMVYTGGINICLGAIVLVVAWIVDREKPTEAKEERAVAHRRLEENLDDQMYKPYAAQQALIAAGLSGFAAMALQVAWIRYFGIVLGATHSAFTIVVAAFIFGIGLGSLLVRTRIFCRFPLPTILACVFAITSTTLGLGLFGYARIPFEISRFLTIIAPSPFSWPFYVILKFGICFALMMLPTVSSGMILPICVRIAGRGSERIGRDVAMVYGINTIGALLGIGITSQLLFRTLTLPRTMQVILLIYLAATIFMALTMVGKGRRMILALAGGLMVINSLFWSPWSAEQLHLNRVDFSKGALTYEHFTKINSQESTVVEDRQGPEVQVTVVDVIKANKTFRSMFINGKPDATNAPDAATEILLGHLPVLLHPAPRNAFVLGLGSGITSGEILKFPEVKKVTTAELAAEVFEASKTFAADNDRFWENPKHRMVIDDGKAFLHLSKERFDVIAMEPTNVWQAGMAGLFSEEFFQLVKSRLTPGGVVAQWMHTYEIDDLTLNIVLKTFSRVFPEASIFEVDPAGDVLLVGYNEQWQFDPLQLERRFYQPQILAAQQRVGNPNPIALLLREVMGRDSFLEYSAVLKAPVNTENFPVLEQAAEYGRFIKQPSTILQGYDARLNPDGNDLLVHDYFRRRAVDQTQLQTASDSEALGENDKLRVSLNLRALDQLWVGGQTLPPQVLMSFVNDPQLREVVLHPYYRLSPANMTPEEAYNMLNAELLMWYKAATQLWTPRPERLWQLYSRLVGGVDRENAGIVAREAALSLARGRACKAALPFFRHAEEKGALAPGSMQPNDIVAAFYCESKEGNLEKARSWWNIIEQRDIPIVEAMKLDKATLDIRLGGQPPPPIYGKLPSRR